MSKIFFYTTVAYRYWVRICHIKYENFCTVGASWSFRVIESLLVVKLQFNTGTVRRGYFARRGNLPIFLKNVISYSYCHMLGGTGSINDVVTRVVYEVSFKHTFNYNIFQILYHSMKIYMVQKMKKSCLSNFYCPLVAYNSDILTTLFSVTNVFL